MWDNDGVLVDTETLFFEVTRATFAELGIQLSREVWGSRYLAEGRRSVEIAIDLGVDAAQAAQVVDKRNQKYWQILQQPPPLRPRIRETLAALQGRVRMAIVTACPRNQLELVHGDGELLRHFELIVTGDDCARTKPHPEPYLAAIKALAVEPSQCLAIEDSPRGVASATAAGVRCLAVPTELTSFLSFPGAHAVVPDLTGILEFI